jgi:Flp pilus assembly protein TadG
MPRLIEAFWRDRLGAISPMYAMALIALIAIAGVGFDYGRLMAMHTELQNAADQAALAAATQLDGRTDAIERARAAATATFATATSGFVNKTRISTDAEGRPVTRLTFTFFDGYGEPDGFARDRTGNETEVGTDAKVVRVVVDDRGVRYALTPIVDAVYGSVPASAMAMLRRAACRVPSMLVCIDRTDFDLPALKGKALRMRWKSSADVTPLAPGNFGFLLSDKETESSLHERTGPVHQPG